MHATIILSLWTMNAIMGCNKVANSQVHKVNSEYYSAPYIFHMALCMQWNLYEDVHVGLE